MKTSFTPTLNMMPRHVRAMQDHKPNREQRRQAKHGNQTPGNNRKNSEGRQIKQADAMVMLTVGDEEKSVEVVKLSRGKGGRKKATVVRRVLSRQILADSIHTGENLDLPMTVTEGEDESIKEGIIRVATRVNGRVMNPKLK